jgi:hypothetical protein
MQPTDTKQRLSTDAGAERLIEVRVTHPQRDVPIYTWNREQDCLRLSGLYQAEAGLPADLAVLTLEGEHEAPVLLITTHSVAPDTLVTARLLGGFSAVAPEKRDDVPPVEGWVFVAVPEVDPALTSYRTLDMLPPLLMEPLQAYVSAQYGEETSAVHLCDAEAAARCLRETRLWFKREQRKQPKARLWNRQEAEDKPVAWRAIEGLSEALRAQLLYDKALQEGENTPHAQAERLIRFVPQRFQQALADLLLDDERLLAFVERPLLRHRTGILPSQKWRSNEGLFLITDRQALWLRDFLSPGSNFLSGGYIAHMAPLERLQNITVVPAGQAPYEYATRLDPSDSPYQRLVMEVASSTADELFTIEFPQRTEMEKILARITGILREFLPYPQGKTDRRLRRVPVVEMWMPRGAEAERLAGLGGTVPPAIVQRLEQRVSSLLRSPGEERLVTALVPALEEYKSPPRLVTLTRTALIVVDESAERAIRRGKRHEDLDDSIRRYELATISSAQLRHSLLGSSLSIFVPQKDGKTRQQVIPFHSPAIAWFLPLFTRLRLLLTGAYTS